MQSIDHIMHARQRKKRLPLSCQMCRRRKLKCDRQTPACARCRADGTAQHCHYDVGPSYHESRPEPVPVDRSTIGTESSEQGQQTEEESPCSLESSDARVHTQAHEILLLRDKVRELEARLPFPLTKEKQSQLAVPMILKFHPIVRTMNENEGMFFKGCDMATAFYGTTNPWTMMNQLPRNDIRLFMKTAHVKCPPFARLRQTVERITEETNRHSDRRQDENIKMATPENLLKLLPNRVELEKLLHCHFRIYGNTYRVLHGPRFWRDYAKFWEEPSRPEYTKFVVLLLLCAATTVCICPGNHLQMIGIDSTSCARAATWIDACSLWHSRQDPHQLIDYQIQCLNLLACIAIFRRPKSTWMDAGRLLTFGVSLGLHRDPEVISAARISPFYQEMRRRLWVAILNLEVEVSIDRGMPSLSANIFKDARPPLNLDDEDLQEALRVLPNAKADHEYTDSSFLVHSAKSLALRVKLNNKLNDPSYHMTYNEVLSHQKDVLSQLADIPAWPISSEGTRSTDLCSMPRALLDIQLRQFLILLHYPFIHEQEYSKLICVDAATKIINMNAQLGEAGVQGLTQMRRDMLRSALCIFQMLLSRNSPQETILIPRGNQDAIRLIDQVMTFFEGKITRNGHGIRSFWMVCALRDTVQLDSASPYSSPIYPTIVIEKLSKLYEKILHLQENAVDVEAITSGKHDALSRNDNVYLGHLNHFSDRSVGRGNTLSWEGDMGMMQTQGQDFNLTFNWTDLAYEDFWQFDSLNT